MPPPEDPSLVLAPAGVGDTAGDRGDLAAKCGGDADAARAGLPGAGVLVAAGDAAGDATGDVVGDAAGDAAAPAGAGAGATAGELCGDAGVEVGPDCGVGGAESTPEGFLTGDSGTATRFAISSISSPHLGHL